LKSFGNEPVRRVPVWQGFLRSRRRSRSKSPAKENLLVTMRRHGLHACHHGAARRDAVWNGAPWPPRTSVWLAPPQVDQARMTSDRDTPPPPDRKLRRQGPEAVSSFPFQTKKLQQFFFFVTKQKLRETMERAHPPCCMHPAGLATARTAAGAALRGAERLPRIYSCAPTDRTGSGGSVGDTRDRRAGRPCAARHCCMPDTGAPL
jgi:hypothetical protein